MRLLHVCQRCFKTLITEKRGEAQIAGLPHMNSRKQGVQNLPRLLFPGKTYIISSAFEEQTFVSVINELLRNKVLGFDTETKPNFLKGNKVCRPPALVQLASNNLCIIWRLQRANRSESVPPLLADILTSNDILKV